MVARFATLLLSTLLIASVSALSADDPSSSLAVERPLFKRHEVLEMTLSADFDALCRPNEVEGCEYSPTTMTLATEDGTIQEFSVEIRVRGGWRARKDHCNVPPLFIRFSGSDTEGTPFAGQGMLPLTTHWSLQKMQTRFKSPRWQSSFEKNEGVLDFSP